MNTIRKCTIDDTEALQDISCRIFKDTFENTCSAQDMQTFLEEAYNLEKLRGELNNQNSVFYFLYVDSNLAGYLKLNEFDAQTELQDTHALEIERIYIGKEFQGMRLGRLLMQEAIKVAKDKEKEFLWLGVWEHNEKALAFYKSHGFYQIGAHAFVMGDDHQTDLLMRKDMVTG
jgi:ribosomal protein S18 acetylase RimI-like enzyme